MKISTLSSYLCLERFSNIKRKKNSLVDLITHQYYSCNLKLFINLRKFLLSKNIKAFFLRK